MRIRDVKSGDVAAGRNWRLKDDASSSMMDWEIEECSTFRTGDTVVYSALALFLTGEVRPLLLVRDPTSYEWWGDTCEYIDGAWRELGRANEWNAETYVADPLGSDPSFMGEYSHDKQRAGFARWCHRLQASTGT